MVPSLDVPEIVTSPRGSVASEKTASPVPLVSSTVVVASAGPFTLATSSSVTVTESVADGVVPWKSVASDVTTNATRPARSSSTLLSAAVMLSVCALLHAPVPKTTLLPVHWPATASTAIVTADVGSAVSTSVNESTPAVASSSVSVVGIGPVQPI